MNQDRALEILMSGSGVFLTGGPGTGKSYVIRQFMQRSGRRVALTASTGIAALNIGGQTIHSWAGLGMYSKLTDADLNRIANGLAGERIRRADALVIDEVSMLSGDTLEAVDLACRAARDAWDSPFGGLQVILTGDFFQLPPVIKGTPRYRFAFEAPAWQALDPAVCYLQKCYRQDGDHEFMALLASIRRNDCDLNDPALWRRCFHHGDVPAGVPHLDTHNDRANALNAVRLHALPGPSVTHHMTSEGPEHLVSALKKGCQSPEALTLKDGATVIFTRNGKGYVNGTTGIVVDARGPEGWPVVELKDGFEITAAPVAWEMSERDEEEEVVTPGGYGRPAFKRTLARITQVPLRLAWGITVHKSQGMSLDAAVIDLSSAFEYGQGYVALSRVRSLDGLYLLGWNTRALEVHPIVLRKDAEFLAASNALESVCARAELRRLDYSAASSAL
jgi:ATP-dependent exoDNAse (exonuclease V) alpha subunit